MKIIGYFLPVLFFFITGCKQETVVADQPNIILFLVDDMGWSDLGCYAQDDFHETPNIDQMAGEGLRFTNAYASCAVCSPTRASIMTGKYPARIKITDWIPGHSTGNKDFITPKYRYEMPLEESTIPEVLKTAGYNTYHIGKWHLGESEQYWPQHQGFDENIGGHSKGAPGSYYFPYAKSDVSHDWTTLNLPAGHEEEDYLTDKLTDHALELIERSVEEKKPFFMNMAYYTVHVPLEGKLDLVEKYKNKFEKGDYEQKDFHYAAMVQSLDESVGRILNKLKELKIEEETFIVLTSDNGGLAGGRFNGNAPLRAGKGTHYEGGIREPFIIRWPGKTKVNALSDQTVISTDIYPTILAAAGVPVPEGQGVDGQSLIPLLDHPEKSIERDAVYWHYPHYHRGKPVSVIRSGDYKLMEFLEDGHLELYNLVEDIGEENNLAEKMSVKAAELQRQLQEWKKSVDAAPFLERNSDTEKFARKGSGWIGSNNIKNPPVFEKTLEGKLRIYTFNEAIIRYTRDGSDPDQNALVYQQDLDISKGAVIKAKSWSPDGIQSDVETFIASIPGVSTISASSSAKEHSMELATDEEEATYWESDGNSLPQEVVFDLGRLSEIDGFIYQPARRMRHGRIQVNTLGNNVDGAISEYELLVSKDGGNWKRASSGTFPYIRYAFLNENKIWFPKPLSFRYAKLLALSGIGGGNKVNVEDMRFISLE